MLEIQWSVVIFFVLGLLLLYGLGWLLLVPFRRLLWWLLNAAIGIILLVVVSAFADDWGIIALLNPFSAIVTGFLGVPGALLVLLIQNLL